MVNLWREIRARERWPRVVAAVARYVAGPRPTTVDLDHATETVESYVALRAVMGSDDESTRLLAGAIERAAAHRHEFEEASR